jgi:hypothetical protein
MSSSIKFRPTRRDVLLVLLTISTSYLFFTPRLDVSAQLRQPIKAISSPSASLSAGSVGAGKKYIPDWLWPVYTPPSSEGDGAGVREETFGESVRTYGYSAVAGSAVEGGRVQGMGLEEWDQGSEEYSVTGQVHGHDKEDREGNKGGLEGMKTELLGHAPGWTLMDRVYIFNGSFYVVTYVRVC